MKNAMNSSRWIWGAGCLLGLILIGGPVVMGLIFISSPPTEPTDDAESPTPNMRSIRAGAEAYTTAHGSLPAPLPRTPAHPLAAGQPWPSDADPRWADLGFHPDVVRYSYEIAAEGEDAIAIRAYGDSDGDGIESLWERSCGKLDGMFDCTPGNYIEREFE